MSRTLPLCVLAIALAAAVLAFIAPRPSVAAEPEAKAAATFEVYKDKAGEFRWRLRMQNTKVIASSGEGYSSKSACESAIDSVKRNAADAPIKEVTADGPAEAK